MAKNLAAFGLVCAVVPLLTLSISPALAAERVAKFNINKLEIAGGAGMPSPIGDIGGGGGFFSWYLANSVPIVRPDPPTQADVDASVFYVYTTGEIDGQRSAADTRIQALDATIANLRADLKRLSDEKDALTNRVDQLENGARH